PQVRLPQTGTAFAGGGQLAFTEEGALTEVDRWGDKRRIPGIIDLLVIKDVRQIQLDVIVAEIALDKLREIGLDFLYNSNSTTFNSFQGSQGGLTTRLFENLEGGVLTFGDATSGILTLARSGYTLTSLYRLFQNRDVTEILAQPKLVLKNGRSGGFLAGGEFPVPIETEDEISVEFKPFGVRLDFVPTITFANNIDLRVFPEVSDVDQSVAVNGIPGLRVRRTVSRVEIKEGESLIIAGLLDRRVLKDLTKVPILGDIPILGGLFRTTRFRNRETELVFVITPKIVKALRPGEKPQLPSVEKYDDPDMRQIPLPHSSGSGAAGKPAPKGPTMP
ncbi:MAG: type II and III secretion system protein family protein, partial [Candidatus Binatia bacterium]